MLIARRPIRDVVFPLWVRVPVLRTVRIVLLGFFMGSWGFAAVESLSKRAFDVRDHGAKGDGRTLDTAAIQAAIDRARDVGGGTVTVPPGNYVTGTLRLYSNIHLVLQERAVLKGSEKISDYIQEGVKLGMIFTQNASNVAISGAGTIDGSGDAFVDPTRIKMPDAATLTYARQGTRCREVLAGLGDGPLVPLARPKQMLIFSNCRNVAVKGVTISNSPYWALHLIDCDGANLSDLTIRNSLLIPNANGIDLSSSSNVHIARCDIRSGDDAIAIMGASHFKDDPGYNGLQHDSERIVVTDCTLESRSAAIRIGGWDQNNLRNLTFDRITIKNSNRGIKIGVRDRGSIENVTFTNVVIQTRLFRGDWWGNGEPIYIYAFRADAQTAIGRVSGIAFHHVSVAGASGMLVCGSPESVIEDLEFSDVAMTLNDSPLNPVCGGNYDLRPCADPAKQIFSHDVAAFHLEYVNNVRLRECEIRWDDVREPYFTHGLEFQRFTNITIENYRGSGAPNNPGAAAVSLEYGRGVQIFPSLTPPSSRRFLISRDVLP
jgi:polygalacturonase